MAPLPAQAEYLVTALAETYDRLEDRVAGQREARGSSKQERVRAFILEQASPRFTIGDVRRAVPGISDQTIRLVLNAMKASGKIRSEGTGRGACWTRV